MIASITADQWNAFIDRKLIDHRILGLTVLNRGGYRHPWQLSPFFDSPSNQWLTRIEPGFVNHLDALVTIPTAIAPPGTLKRLNISPAQQVNNSTPVDSWLTEEPSLPLDAWRSIGADAAPSQSGTDANGLPVFSYAAVPPFFAALGVGAPPAVVINADGTQSQSGEIGTFDPSRRLLRACDVVLYQDRPALSSQWITSAAGGQTLASFSVIASYAPGSRSRAYLRTTDLYSQPNAQIDLLTGNVQDLSRDSWLLGTVWLVSPPGLASGSPLDGSWSPYVSHRLFRNRNYATQNIAPVVQTTLSLDTGLAGGVGDPTNDFITAQINDQNSAAAQFLAQNTTSGKAWSV